MYRDSYLKRDNASLVDKTKSNIRIKESIVMNVQDTQFRINQGHIIQKTSDLTLMVNLIQNRSTFWKCIMMMIKQSGFHQFDYNLKILICNLLKNKYINIHN